MFYKLQIYDLSLDTYVEKKIQPKPQEIQHFFLFIEQTEVLI